MRQASKNLVPINRDWHPTFEIPTQTLTMFECALEWPSAVFFPFLYALSKVFVIGGSQRKLCVQGSSLGRRVFLVYRLVSFSDLSLVQFQFLLCLKGILVVLFSFNFHLKFTPHPGHRVLLPRYATLHSQSPSSACKVLRPLLHRPPPCPEEVSECSALVKFRVIFLKRAPNLPRKFGGIKYKGQ